MEDRFFKGLPAVTVAVDAKEMAVRPQLIVRRSPLRRQNPRSSRLERRRGLPGVQAISPFGQQV
jgi:hypothetical protein